MLLYCNQCRFQRRETCLQALANSAVLLLFRPTVTNPDTSAETSKSPASPQAGLARIADRFGATASFLCAVHCALLPFVVALLPTLGLGFLADHDYEQMFIVFACLLAGTTIVLGVRHHGDRRALALVVPGIGLLLAGVAVEFDELPIIHATLVCCGGSLLALAHVVNLRLGHVHNLHCEH